TKHFKPTALHALGFLEIFKVDDPHKVSYSTEVLKLIMLQTVLVVNRKISTVCIIFGNSK
ncbi:MAG: hypothetical protein ACFFD1_16450, partial [Candidatus Thorarchaeota archaeon]